MIDEPLSEDVEASINARSAQLLDEFAKHYQDVSHDLRGLHSDVVERDGGIDQHKIFRGWAIQKLASLQLLVENLVDRMVELEGE